MNIHHWFGRHHHHDHHAAHERHDCIGRGGRFAGFGEGGGGFFGRGGRDDGRGGRHGGGMGRMFGPGDLKLLILTLIAVQPRHGYELIRAIEDMFGGNYSPSPGTIYPTLTLLEDQGYARIETTEGSKKLYAITPEGEVFLEANREAAEGVSARLDVTAKAMAGEAPPNAIREVLHTLRHALKLHRGPWTAEKIVRVKLSIENVIAEISKG